MADEQSIQKPAPPRPTYVPAKKPYTDFPLIDNDPRVVGYARRSDYAWGAAWAVMPPAAMAGMELVSPSHVGKGAYPPIMRLAAGIGLAGGFLYFYQRSILRFYGVTENQREVDMDMREMVGRVKKGEPIYGHSELTEHMQGVAARNSRYTGVFLHIMPMFNFVNHSQHGVDTAKYYRQAEIELEAEKNSKE